MTRWGIDARGTFWGLVATAAAERPDAVILSDDHGRAAARAPSSSSRAERSPRRCTPAGSGRRTTVSWQLPTTLEAPCCWSALRPPRGGAEPAHPAAARARGRVHHRPGRHRPADRAPALARLRPRRDGARDRVGRGCARARARPRRPRRPDRRRAAPAGAATPTALPAPPEPPPTATGAVDLLLVGHDGGAEGRAPHRPHRHGVGAGTARGRRVRRRRRLPDRLADRAHRRGRRC